MKINPGDTQPAAQSSFSLFNLGFRPFYLGGALFGALAILLWINAFHNGASIGESGVITGMLWH